MAFNKDPSCLGNPKDIAIRRLNSLWKRLSRDSRYLSLYAEFLKEYEELGHLERVVESSEPPTHYYIPHHGVLRPEKLTTKLRIVFNGSSPTTTGISLNDILLKGEVKEDVFETISRFRRHKFAFTTDIQKMYRQILINPDQQDLQRIIWKHGLDAEILTYRLKTVTYGLSNAPFLAIRTLQQLAKDEKSRFPFASETLLYDTYMDDIVSGAPDLETAQQLQSQLKDALQSCGMNLHKWSSNSPELLNSSLSSDVEHSFSTDIDLSVKTLIVFIETGKKLLCHSKRATGYCKAIEHFHHYLYGQKFLLRTDHASLTWLMNFKTLRQVARWIQRLNEYYFDIRHRKKASHGNADVFQEDHAQKIVVIVPE
ncbi:integrase catalytic domain-containing protein [Trichonephila clavipes]|nr:integrase catalytic domain-containing protein [Trichonephila clavipes]